MSDTQSESLCSRIANGKDNTLAGLIAVGILGLLWWGHTLFEGGSLTSQNQTESAGPSQVPHDAQTARSPTSPQVRALVTQYIEDHQGSKNSGYSLDVRNLGIDPSGGYSATGSIAVANESGSYAYGLWGAKLTASGESYAVSDLTFKDEISNVSQ